MRGLDFALCPPSLGSSRKAQVAEHQGKVRTSRGRIWTHISPHFVHGCVDELILRDKSVFSPTPFALALVKELRSIAAARAMRGVAPRHVGRRRSLDYPVGFGRRAGFCFASNAVHLSRPRPTIPTTTVKNGAERKAVLVSMCPCSKHFYDCVLGCSRLGISSFQLILK